MSCERFEKLLALQVAGDLGKREARRLEEHLRQCSACREFAEGLAESQELIRELSQESVDERALAQVRRRVLSEVEGRRPPLRYAWRWKYAVAACVVMLLVAVWIVVRQRPEKAPVAQVTEIPKKIETPAPAPPAPAKKTAERPRAVVQAKVKRPVLKPDFELPQIEPARIEPPESPNQLVVKLLTDDPEIVIVWLIDENGDRNGKAN